MDRAKPYKTLDPDANDDTVTTAERRRIARIVHDERGTASVEWLDAPADYERPVLELDDTPSLTTGDTQIRRGLPVLSVVEPNAGSFNPYESQPTPSKEPKSCKRDLRQLSEWIKMTRELQQRKQRGED